MPEGQQGCKGSRGDYAQGFRGPIQGPPETGSIEQRAGAAPKRRGKGELPWLVPPSEQLEWRKVLGSGFAGQACGVLRTPAEAEVLEED